MTEKARRQARIAETLRASRVRSQEALREALRRSGFDVTQGALSRDLRDLGAVKTPEGYALPGDATLPAGPAPARARDAHRALRSFITAADLAGNIVVLRTGPGHAQALAAELDAAAPALNGAAGLIVGTIAGDDTVFVAARTAKSARTLLKDFRSLAGLA